MSLKNPKLQIDHLRVEAAYYDLDEISHNTGTGQITFLASNDRKLHVYTTTATVTVEEEFQPFKVTKGNSFTDVISLMSKLSEW